MSDTSEEHTLLGEVASEQKREERKPTNWDFTCIETLDHKKLVTVANEMGDRGWELFDVEQLGAGFWVGFLKRESGIGEREDVLQPNFTTVLDGGAGGR